MLTIDERKAEDRERFESIVSALGTPYWSDGSRAVFQGDCRDLLAKLPESVFDSLVTDPPYGFAFMSQDWDREVPDRSHWEPALRVAKPGAMLAAFSVPRMVHKLVATIDESGWEIRDRFRYEQSMPQLYGPFIESLTEEQRERLYDLLADVAGAGELAWMFGNGFPKPHNLKGAFEGWGMALKPAYEPIALAMKPPDGTYQASADAHGVGGLCLSEAKIGNVVAGWSGRGYSGKRKSMNAANDGSLSKSGKATKSVGRFPANLAHDGSVEVTTRFPASNPAPGGSSKTSIGGSSAYNGGGERKANYHNDRGSASRFFFCGKATTAERGEGNDHPTVKPLAMMTYLVRLFGTPSGGVLLDQFAGSGTTLLAARNLGRLAIGFEREEKYCGIIAKRLSARPKR